MLARVHPVSLALGLALGICAILSMSQASVINTPLRVEYMPHPRDMVQIKEGTPYTVPVGKVFVVTGLGSTAAVNAPMAALAINGTVEATTIVQGCGGTETRSVVELVAGLTAPAGSTISVQSNYPDPDDGRAWGYLVAQ